MRRRNRTDTRFAPRWALANFYFRTRDSAAFWYWARQAAARAYEDDNLGALFQLCWMLSQDGKLIFRLLATVGLTRFLRSMLFEVSPLDPLAIALACTAMLLIGLLAAAIPARRAASVDPVTILRDDG